MRLLVVALAVSLVFNIAVLIGFVQRRAAEPGSSAPESAAQPDSRAQQQRRLARELGLEQWQSVAFEDLQSRQQQLSALFADSVAVIRQDLAAELAKDGPDLDRVRALVDQEAELTRQRRRAGADLYAEFVGVLTPAQRQRLGERFSAPAGPVPLPQQHRSAQPQRSPVSPDLVRRFDRNANGRLDGDEPQAARRELDRRRREVAPHLPRRPPLWPWFDADDDGQLNEAERAKMEAFMRENNISPQEVQPPPQSRQPGAPGRPGRRPADRRPDQQPSQNGPVDVPPQAATPSA
jgi:Spy/CpxP family protein refolding chaperone